MTILCDWITSSDRWWLTDTWEYTLVLWRMLFAWYLYCPWITVVLCVGARIGRASWTMQVQCPAVPLSCSNHTHSVCQAVWIANEYRGSGTLGLAGSNGSLLLDLYLNRQTVCLGNWRSALAPTVPYLYRKSVSESRSRQTRTPSQRLWLCLWTSRSLIISNHNYQPLIQAWLEMMIERLWRARRLMSWRWSETSLSRSVSCGQSPRRVWWKIVLPGSKFQRLHLRRCSAVHSCVMLCRHWGA